MIQPLDGPSKQFSISVDSSTVKEVKAGASAFNERKVITLQPLGGDIWVYFADEGETPDATDVSTKGFQHFKKNKESYEASHQQSVFILAVTSTADVRGAERA